jgi:hypothetical protein
MRARDRELPPGAGAEHGIDAGLVGIGDALRAVPRSLAEALAGAEQEHGVKAGRMLKRFAELPVGSLVWTRTVDGRYAVGRISGPWRYDDSPPARRVGIHHVRPARWGQRLLNPEEVPIAVVETFARGGRNFQRIHSDLAEHQTTALVGPGDVRSR